MASGEAGGGETDNEPPPPRWANRLGGGCGMEDTCHGLARRGRLVGRRRSHRRMGRKGCITSNR
eukprot:scaffold102_cov340-Pavlova_lutheri.AAC.48